MACECIVQLDPNKPIKAGKRQRLGKHVASVQYSPNYAKKPDCKPHSSCTREEIFNWTINVAIGHLDLFDENEETCLVIGNGEFTLNLTVTVKCYEATADDEDDDSGVAEAAVTSCSDQGSSTRTIKSR